MDNTENMNGVVPPHNPEAELSVLGAMLQDSDAVHRALELLTKDDFYLPENREIFAAMEELTRNNRPIDAVTMHAELSRRGTLEGIGGPAALTRIMDAVPVTANANSYIEIVREKSTLRRLISACRNIIADCYKQQKPLPEILASAEKAVFDIVMDRTDGEALQPIGRVVVKAYDKIEELAKQKGEIAGVPTGFIDLDNYLTGLHPGELIIVGARPGMGKTSFAMNIAANASVNKGKKVAVFTLEMPREQIAMRVLCADARVNMQQIRKGNVSSDDWMKLARSMTPIAAAPLYIDDTAGIIPAQLRSRCRRMMAEKGLDLVVVDYLGLMHTDGRAENRVLEVSEISRQLKAIALDLKVPVIACAQLSRANKERTDKRPLLSDLRDSGSIEQDADVVLFLHRDDYYKHEAENNIGEVIIAKQRNGPLGSVKVAWLGEYTSFASLAKDENIGDGSAPY